MACTHLPSETTATNAESQLSASASGSNLAEVQGPNTSDKGRHLAHGDSKICKDTKIESQKTKNPRLATRRSQSPHNAHDSQTEETRRPGLRSSMSRQGSERSLGGRAKLDGVSTMRQGLTRGASDRDLCVKPERRSLRQDMKRAQSFVGPRSGKRSMGIVPPPSFKRVTSLGDPSQQEKAVLTAKVPNEIVFDESIIYWKRNVKSNNPSIRQKPKHKNFLEAPVEKKARPQAARTVISRSVTRHHSETKQDRRAGLRNNMTRCASERSLGGRTKLDGMTTLRKSLSKRNLSLSERKQENGSTSADDTESNRLVEPQVEKKSRGLGERKKSSRSVTNPDNETNQDTRAGLRNIMGRQESERSLGGRAKLDGMTTLRKGLSKRSLLGSGSTQEEDDDDSESNKLLEPQVVKKTRGLGERKKSTRSVTNTDSETNQDRRAGLRNIMARQESERSLDGRTKLDGITTLRKSLSKRSLLRSESKEENDDDDSESSTLLEPKVEKKSLDLGEQKKSPRSVTNSDSEANQDRRACLRNSMARENSERSLEGRAKLDGITSLRKSLSIRSLLGSESKQEEDNDDDSESNKVLESQVVKKTRGLGERKKSSRSVTNAGSEAEQDRRACLRNSMAREGSQRSLEGRSKLDGILPIQRSHSNGSLLEREKVKERFDSLFLAEEMVSKRSCSVGQSAMRGVLKRWNSEPDLSPLGKARRGLNGKQSNSQMETQGEKKSRRSIRRSKSPQKPPSIRRSKSPQKPPSIVTQRQQTSTRPSLRSGMSRQVSERSLGGRAKLDGVSTRRQGLTRGGSDRCLGAKPERQDMKRAQSTRGFGDGKSAKVRGHFSNRPKASTEEDGASGYLPGHLHLK